MGIPFYFFSLLVPLGHFIPEAGFQDDSAGKRLAVLPFLKTSFERVCIYIGLIQLPKNVLCGVLWGLFCLWVQFQKDKGIL